MDPTGVAGHLRFDRARSDGSVACGQVIDFNYEQELFLFKLTRELPESKLSHSNETEYR